MANWYGGESSPTLAQRLERELRCLACGRTLEEPLRLVGSLRCLDCRGANEPIDPALVDADPDLAH